MDQFLITGGTPLRGEVQASGAKNAALPLLAATLLTDEPMRLTNIPAVNDIKTMWRLLEHMGAILEGEHDLTITVKNLTTPEAPYEIVKTMRASSMVLGPLLARTGLARVSLPGGCAIGARPLDLHLKAFQQMGAQIEINEGYITARAKNLRGADITFDKVTVTGTENVMMCAVLAQGTTILRNAAREPEVPTLAACLAQMGAQIDGAGTSTITITGVERLHGTTFTNIPDRIEVGTHMIAAAMTRGDVIIRGAVAAHVDALITHLQRAGVSVEEVPHGVRVYTTSPLKAVDCDTAPFPGFATDLQAQWMAAMTLARGTAKIHEAVFENRFMHVAELQRFGAKISVDGSIATVEGVDSLRGAPVMATDLRASACLVLAALAAEGETTIQRVYHLDRGYEHFERKLCGLGANIQRVRE